LILRAVRAEASHHEAFDMLAEGIGAFPNARRPRVLWVGLEAPPTLALLQRDLDSATRRLGYKSEEREFSPHLTIGYVRSGTLAAGPGKIREALVGAHVGNLGSQHVDAVHLFKSDLERTGAVHTKMLSAPLGKA
jgi:2'-5' RNA ligase